jgi:hypothetical protein
MTPEGVSPSASTVGDDVSEVAAGWIVQAEAACANSIHDVLRQKVRRLAENVKLWVRRLDRLGRLSLDSYPDSA